MSSIDYDGLGHHLNVVADFGHTLTYTLVGSPGSGDIIGESGHDYSTSLSAVPEPATWVMMLMGFARLAFAGARGARIRASHPN